jgi:hypothetical protein
MACLCACAATPAHERANVGKPERGPAASPVEKERPTVADATLEMKPRRTNELAAPGVDDRFAVAQQVAALERSIELYQAFIARAGDEPQFAEAVRRSRGRIEDARLTICFLLEKPCDDGSTGK